MENMMIEYTVRFEKKKKVEVLKADLGINTDG